MSRSIREVSRSPHFTRTLERRVRPDAIKAQLMQLEGQSPSAVFRRIADRQKESRLSNEAIVSVLRGYLRADDLVSANRVFLILIDRLSGAIANQLVRWRSLSFESTEDTRQSVVLGLFEYLYSLEPSEELWECNFKTCFDMRLLNIFGKLVRKQQQTVSTTVEDDGEHLVEGFDSADPAAEIDFQNIEVKEALTYLDGIDSRLGKAFYLKFFAELPEKDISDMMEVSERTVRNWIVRSRNELRRYFAEP
jgi:RNA polymerase sigma factor (sigma-70 family)